MKQTVFIESIDKTKLHIVPVLFYSNYEYKMVLEWIKSSDIMFLQSSYYIYIAVW